MASNSGVATLRNFCWAVAHKNACWGASPNPALWNKMSQRGWLRHRRCRAGSLLFRLSFRLDRRLMLCTVIDRRKGAAL